MGVLEEAIKEHLDLKRRHGASEDEVQKQEAEALGPARRESPAESTPAPGEEPEAGAEATPVPGTEAAPEPEAAETELLQPADDLVEAEPTEEPGDAHPEPVQDEHMPAEPEELHHEPEAPAHEEPHGEDERAEAAADEDEDAEPAADEDVLEETPEFLQETPEHDRLWFEQKPPRDFDFD